MERRGRAALPRALCPEHDLEELAVLRATNGRRVGRVRWDIEVLSSHEARTDLGPVERAAHPVAQEVDPIRLYAPVRQIHGHARTLAPCHRWAGPSSRRRRRPFA